jgi:hypothetical protein
VLCHTGKSPTSNSGGNAGFESIFIPMGRPIFPVLHVTLV